MSTRDIVDDVNALLKLGVGDAYRLEHIKQSYINNKTIWITDNNYLQQMIGKYLTKHQTNEQKEEGEESEDDDPENKDTVHCWKCGKKGPLGANFCMNCGSSIFEVGTEPQTVDVQIPSKKKTPTNPIGLKIPIMIGIPVLILIILGGAYSQGYFDNALESSSDTVSTPIIEDEVVFYGEYDPKCGEGTVLDPDTNACRVGKILNTIDSDETNSKCGPGTIFDPDTNSCVLDK